MVDRHHQTEAMRRDIATSTDPQWMREQYGQPEQFSKAFIIVTALVGALAFYGVFAAIASI